MIECRRLFLRSDFLRDITQPALFRKLLCSLRVYYQETTKLLSNRPRTSRLATQTGLIEIRKLDLVLFAKFAFLIRYVYQINWDCFRWGHAFRRKRSSRELRSRRCR